MPAHVRSARSIWPDDARRSAVSAAEPALRAISSLAHLLVRPCHSALVAWEMSHWAREFGSRCPACHRACLYSTQDADEVG